jgi:hypothetical protein
MRRYDAEIVTALYLHRGGVQSPTLWKFPRGGGNDPLVSWPPDEIIEADCAGAGALLVKNRVFDRIREEVGEEPFSTQEFPQVIGEDFAFFRRCNRLGIRAVCDPRIECPHLAVRPLRFGVDYDPDRPGVATKEIKTKAIKTGAA